MTAIDFLLACVGMSTIVLALAGAIRIVKGVPSTRPRPTPATQVRVEHDPADDMGARVRAFQEARFSSPIVQRSNVSPERVIPRWKVSTKKETPLLPREKKEPKKDE